jgi:hypothetical protein
LKIIACAQNKWGLGLVGLLLAGSALADDGGFDGYSYAVLGSESLNFQEKPSSVPLNTNTRVKNVALRAGGLFPINHSWDFSLDTGTTLLPGTATETWNVNGGSAGDAFRAGLPQPGSPVQENDFRLSSSGFQVLLHYKHTDRFRTVYGTNYSLNSFRRFNWSTVQGSAVTLPQGAVEEDTANLDAVVGVDFESGALAQQSHRWQMRALLHAPVWRQTTNTNNPGLTFTGTNGVAVDIHGSYNYRFYRGLEAGFFASYGLREEGEDSKGNVELPKSTMKKFFIGLQFGWNLSRKDF